MNIQEMHNTFRTLGQQMGMQLIRGILPESIDVYLNDAIIEKTQQELLSSVDIAIKSSVDTQASTMSAINTFKTLFKSVRYKIDTNKIDYYNKDNGFYIINIPTVNSDITVDEHEYRINPMMFLGFSIEYSNTLRGSSVDCRIVGSDVIETTLRDYCNSASKEAPIVVLNSIPNIENGNESQGVDSNQQLEIYTDTKDCEVKFLNIKYIKVPNVVKYDKDINKCVNCDLPIHTHFEIVERAVAKFYASIGVSTPNQSVQQQR